MPPFAARRLWFVHLALVWASLVVPLSAGAAGLGALSSRIRLELQQSSSGGAPIWRTEFDQGGLWSDGLAAGLNTRLSWRYRSLDAEFGWRGRGGEHVPLKGSLLAAWVGLRRGPAYVGVGRRSVSWSRAPGATLLLSPNAPPLDHVQLALESDRLPTVGGRGRAETCLAYINEGSRVRPYPLLWGMRVFWEPVTWFRCEVQRTIMMGGGGRTERLSAGDLMDIFLGRGEGAEGPTYRPADTDQKFAYLFRWSPQSWVRERFGIRNLILYWFYGGEDRFEGLAPMAPGRSYGLQIDPTDHFGFEAEYTNTSDDQNIWYWHKIYGSGYTYDGFILGHPLGGDARRWRGRLTLRPGVESSWWFEGLREERGIQRDQAAWLPVPSGGFWRFESGIVSKVGGRHIEVTVGAQLPWGADQAVEEQVRGFGRFEIDLVDMKPGGISVKEHQPDHRGAW